MASYMTMLEFQIAPWKINMEPTNHPFGKENDLNQTSMIMCKMLIFRGVLHMEDSPRRMFTEPSKVLCLCRDRGIFQ